MVRNEEDLMEIEFDLVNYYKTFSERMKMYQGEELCGMIKEKNEGFNLMGCLNDYNKILTQGLREVITVMETTMFKVYYSYVYDTNREENHIAEFYLNETDTCTLSKL